MSIEIKEFHIKINVEETISTVETNNIKTLDIDKLKSVIIKECSRKILDKLKEKTER